jgi:hypothetical protein
MEQECAVNKGTDQDKTDAEEDEVLHERHRSAEEVAEGSLPCTLSSLGVCCTTSGVCCSTSCVGTFAVTLRGRE